MVPARAAPLPTTAGSSPISLNAPETRTMSTPPDASERRFTHGTNGRPSRRPYATRTLPLGVLAALRATLRGDRLGLMRAGAIGAGLGVAAVGYVCGGS